MRRGSRLQWFVSFVALACATAPAGAQTATPPEPPAVDARVGFKAHVALTPEDQVAEAETIAVFITQATQALSRRLAGARAQSDIVKSLCIADKLSQLGTVGHTAEERKRTLEAAAGRHDSALANHEFTILGVIRQRADQLMTEANQCIGEQVTYAEATTTFTTTDPSLPPPNETGLPPFGSSNIPAPPVEVPPPQPNSPSK